MATASDISNRMRDYAVHKGLNIRAFEMLCGLSNGYVKNAKSVGALKLEGILKAFPNLNKDWLLYGIGEMEINNSSAAESLQQSSGIEASEGSPKIEYILMHYKSELLRVCEERDKYRDMLIRLMENAMMQYPLSNINFANNTDCSGNKIGGNIE